MDLSEDDIAALKAGLGRLRKARDDRPVGFWYCQEAFDGLPRLLVAPAKKKVVPSKLTAPLKRSAKKKGRICQGTAWRDATTRQLRFAVVHGGFSDRQFLKDVRKLGKLAGVAVGRVTIGIVEDDGERATLGQSMLSEIEAGNAALREAAARLSGPESLAALAGIEDLSDAERQAFFCGAGAEQYTQARSHTVRLMDWVLGRDDDGATLGVGELWAFHQQNRAEHLDERAAHSATWSLGAETTTSLLAHRDSTIPAFEAACAQVEAAARSQAAGRLALDAAEAAHQAIAVAWPPLFQKEQLVRVALQGCQRVGATLTGTLQDEIGYDAIRQKDLATTEHAATATGWRAETEGTLSEVTPAIEAVTGLPGPDATRPARAARLTEIALRLSWPTDALEEEQALKGELEALATDPRVSAVSAAEQAVEEQEAAFEEADRVRRACLRLRNDAEPEELEAAEAALAEAAARCDALQAPRRAALARLQAAEATAAEVWDSRSERMAELVALRAELKEAAAAAVEQQLTADIAADPRAAALDTALDDATAEAAVAEQAVTGLRARLQAQAAERARLLAATGDGRQEAYAAAREESVAADAALLRCQRQLEALAADLPEPVPGPLAAQIAALEAQEAALMSDAVGAEVRRDEARVGARLAALDDEISRCGTELAQIAQAADELEASVERLAADAEDLEAMRSEAPPEQRPQLSARIEALGKERRACKAALKALKKQSIKRKRDLGHAQRRRDDFRDENAELSAWSDEQEAQRREAARARLAAHTAAEDADKAALATAEVTLAGAEAARVAAAEAMAAHAAGGSLEARLAYAADLRQRADAEADRETVMRAVRLQETDQREVRAIKAESAARLAHDQAALSVFAEIEDRYALTEPDEDGRSGLERLRAAHGDGPVDAALAARDAILADVARLQALGEPESACVPLLAALPKALWPDALVAEAQDYARIRALFEEESAEERAAREEGFRNQAVDTLSGLGVEDALTIGMDLSNLYLCDADAVATFTGLELDTTQGWQMLAAVGVVASTNDLVRTMLAKGSTMPEGVSDLELRQLREDLSRTGFEKARAMLPQANELLDSVDFALSSHKDSIVKLLRAEAIASRTAEIAAVQAERAAFIAEKGWRVGALGAEQAAALDAALPLPAPVDQLFDGYGGDVLLPGPGVLYGLIRSGLALKKAHSAQQKATQDAELLEEMSEAGDDTLVAAMENRARRSQRDRNAAVTDAFVTNVNLVAKAGSTLGGVGSTVSAGAWAVGATTGTGHLLWSKVVDWKQAAKLKETLQQAVQGSRRAMMDVFRQHQAFATMLMVTRARDGDAAAMKFCVSRGLNEGEVLDTKASLRLLREHLLTADGQDSEAGSTFSESCAGLWDSIVGMGRRVSRLLSRATEEERKDLSDQREDDTATEAQAAEQPLPDARELETAATMLVGLQDRIRRRDGLAVSAEEAELSVLRASVAAAVTRLEAACKQRSVLQRWKPTPERAAQLDADRGLAEDFSALRDSIDAEIAGL